MRAGGWADVWTLILELISRELVPIRIAAGLAVAFVFVMVLEGLRASFFPKHIAERVAAVEPAREEEDAGPSGHSFGSTEQQRSMAFGAAGASDREFAMVNSNSAFRSSPQQLRVLRARKPSR